jgi:hypothetical protein
MATSAERMKGLRERERRELRRFTVPVSEDDLRVMAWGYHRLVLHVTWVAPYLRGWKCHEKQ